MPETNKFAIIFQQRTPTETTRSVINEFTRPTIRVVNFPWLTWALNKHLINTFDKQGDVESVPVVRNQTVPNICTHVTAIRYTLWGRLNRSLWTAVNNLLFTWAAWILNYAIELTKGEKKYNVVLYYWNSF